MLEQGAPRDDAPRQGLGQRARQALRRHRAQITDAYQHFESNDGDLLAGGIAFFSVLSLAPTLVIALALAGRVLGGRALSGVLVAELRPLLGETAATFVAQVINNSQASGLSRHAAVIGALVTVYASTRLFIQVQIALNRVFGDGSIANLGASLRERAVTVLRKRLLSFALVLGLGGLLALTAIAKTVLSWIAGHVGLPDVPLLWHAGDLAVSFGALVCTLAAIYRVLPDRSIGARHALHGGVITAVFLAIGATLVSVYLDSFVVASAFGAAGSLVVFMLSAYYGAIIFLFGAELTAVYAREEGVLAASSLQRARNSLPP